MEKPTTTRTLGEIAELLGGQLCGPAGLLINRPVPSDSNDPSGITFAENSEFLAKAETSGVGAVLVARGSDCCKPHIQVDHPRVAFGQLLSLFVKPLPIETGIHPTAVVDPWASVAPGAYIGAYCVVERGAVIEDHARVYPFCYIGENCVVGARTTIFPHVVLYQDVEIGENCSIHSGVVLGADGFGFGWDGQVRIKVPQIGGVQIGDGAEIGANTTVDRATAGTTRIGSGTKIDNLVQIAHNVQIGDNSIIAAQSGISGSTKLGNRVVMGGGVGTADHVTITDDVSLGGRSGVAQDITKAGEYFGQPAMPKREAIRVLLLQGKLPDLFARLRALESKVEALENPQVDPA